MRPDITKAHIAIIIGAVVQFTRAFGIWDPGADQVDALNVASAMLVSVGFADAAIRFGRNLAKH